MMSSPAAAWIDMLSLVCARYDFGEPAPPLIVRLPAPADSGYRYLFVAAWEPVHDWSAP